ncbi:MAG: GntR family transcriptional regulator [Thermoleophilia bacterium]|nr:GntR family transcriptional regulator [Thermoleophilia bacterium]
MGVLRETGTVIRRGTVPRRANPHRPGRASPPAYAYIADTISARLASGFYHTGSRLPSVSQFCAEFGVSHMTMRRALTILIDKGLISAERGRGTFARAFDLADSVFTLRQFAGDYLDDSAEVRLLSASMARAGRQAAAALAVSVGSRVIDLRHSVLVGGAPAIYHWEYLLCDPCEPLVERLLGSTSLHGLLHESEGAGFPRGRITLRASILGAAAGRVLGRPPQTPGLHIEHLFQDNAGRPVGWGGFVLRADLFALQAHLGPDASQEE